MDNPFVKGIQRLSLMRVPLDIVPEDEIGRLAIELAESEGHKKVVFLNYRKFMKARHDPEFMGFLQRSALVIPTSKSLEWACRFLKFPQPSRHYPFEFIIRLLGALEEKKKTLYLLGEDHKSIQTIAANVRTSFPGVTMVGRHSGHYAKDKEEPILSAIQKASPSVLLIGPGIPSKDKWAFRQGNDLAVRLSLFSDETFRIMSGKKRRPSKQSFKSGTHELYKTLLNPLRLFRLFSYFIFLIIVIFYRIRK